MIELDNCWPLKSTRPVYSWFKVNSQDGMNCCPVQMTKKMGSARTGQVRKKEVRMGLFKYYHSMEGGIYPYGNIQLTTSYRPFLSALI